MMRFFILSLIVCFPAYALEKYTYQSEWKVSYKDNQDIVIETLHWQGAFSIPNSDCKVRPVAHQKKPSVFERQVVCGEITHILGCSLEETDENDLKECQVDIDGVGSLFVRVNRYMTHRWRMIQEAEFERRHKGTY